MSAYFWLISAETGLYLTERDDLTLGVQKQGNGNHGRRQMWYVTPDGSFHDKQKVKIGCIKSELLLGVTNDKKSVRTGVPQTRWRIEARGKNVLLCPATERDDRAITVGPDKKSVIMAPRDGGDHQKWIFKQYP